MRSNRALPRRTTYVDVSLVTGRSLDADHRPTSTQPAAYPTPEVLTEDATIPYERIVSNAKIDPRARQAAVVLDARAYPRFTGEAPEPRPGLPSGHIPNSKSLPFSELVVDGKLLGDEEVCPCLSPFTPT